MQSSPGMQRLLMQARAISSSSKAAAELAPVAASGGVLSWFGGKSRVTTPLSEPISVTPTTYVAPTKPPALATSQLASTKIATLDVPGPVGTLALYIGSGSQNETAQTAGASFFLSHLAFKATANRTTFSLVRELERIGASPLVFTSREASCVGISFLKLHVPEALELLFDSVLNARINSWEVRDLLETVQAAAAEAHANPATLLPEVLHRTAYDGGLGNSYIPDPSVIGSLDAAAIKSFIAANFTPSNMVLAGAGVDHETLKTLAGPMLASSGAAPAKVSSTYVGGGVNVIAESSQAHVALAFEVKGGSSDVKSVAAAAVAKVLLEGSREALPYMRKELDVVTSLTPFSYTYKDSGLIGVTASAAPADASKMVDLVSAKLNGLAKSVAEAELQAAKQVVVGSYQASLASTTGVAQDIGSQLLTQGKFDPAAYIKAVTALTAADVTAFVAKATKTPATFVSYGSLGTLLRYSDVSKRFG